MISVGMVILNEETLSTLNTLDIEEFDIKNMATSAKTMFKEEKISSQELVEEKNPLTEIEMETAPAAVIIPPRVEVFESMTMEELSEKLNRSLGGILAGHGNIIASHSIEIGVDPYLATAIMMHETGNGTSSIANNCYNFGGQKGYGCGSYKRYESVEAGLVGIIDNLYKNYYAYGLNTVESIGRKYAESQTWPSKINWYIQKIREK